MLGKSVSGYDILAKAGEGGMGVVYRGRDQRLGREVALKFLPPELLGSAEARVRFEREARTISSVSHPNIATLYSLEGSQDGSFLVFEYLSGGTLSDRLSRPGRNLPPVALAQGLEWASQIAAGLAHAHRRGIVHRDIKPGNVMFDADDRAKITDFGLAKAECEQVGVTRPGTTVGTAAYLAPEQIIGADADARSDIFSFGVLLYELFAGQRPFATDDTRGAFFSVLHLEPEIPAAKRSVIPEPLSALILRCLKKDPAQRPQSMDEVALALRGLATDAEGSRTADTQTFVGTGMAAQPAATPAPAVRRWRPTRWMRAALFVMLLLLAGIPIRAWLWEALPWNALPEERKVAVLLFENLDGSPDQEAFCNGLSDSLTAMVTQMGQSDRPLWVVPASEVRAEGVRSVREARELFAVNLAVTGSLRRSAEQVTVTLSLVDARQARQLESRTVQVAPAELPRLESRMVEAVSAMLRATVPERGKVYAHPEGLAASAYELCMQGRGYVQRFDLPGNLDRAQAAFEQALALEPRYSLAHAGLGDAFLARHSLTQDAQWLARAQQSTERAIQIDPHLSAARVNLCLLYTRTSRYAEAIAEGRLARDLDPLDASASRALALAFSRAGESAQAEQTYKQAIELQPGFWLPYKDLGVHYLNAGRYADAEAMFRTVIDKTPDNEWGYRNLAIVFHLTGQYAEAEKQLLKAVERKPTGESYSNLGSVYYAQGRHAQAAQAYEKAAELSPGDAIVWGNLGDAWRALPETRAKAEGVYQKAIELGERQLGINTKDPQLLLGMALYAAKLGLRPQAESYLARAETLQPESAAVLFQVAIVQELTGRRKQSLRSIERALAQGYPVDEVRREPELAALQMDTEFKRILDAKRAR
ncbi:MAG: tetratricopeptide repeat protein [Bryobacterales bacterium]|nr:tetratricopeptide repeat protein [Bryobacterales bacterium]